MESKIAVCSTHKETKCRNNFHKEYTLKVPQKKTGRDKKCPRTETCLAEDTDHVKNKYDASVVSSGKEANEEDNDDDDDSKKSGTDRLLNKKEFEELFDTDGRIDDSKFRKSIFERGGIHPCIRSEAWKFLFGMYPPNCSALERSALNVQLHVMYKLMTSKWQQIMPSAITMNLDGTDKDLLTAVSYYKQHQKRRIVAEIEMNEEMESHIFFVRTVSKIILNRETINEDVLEEAVRAIDKDVPRTDRDLRYYQNEGLTNLLVLRNILITYAAYHPDMGYTQGMNDIVSRFLEVLDSEVNAYWSFCAYMSKVSLPFREEGLQKKIDLEEQLLKKLDPELHAHVTKIDVDRLTFCHRWLLLGFQREFKHQEALRLFEILSSNHLELNSFEAEKTRCLERLSCIQQKGGDAGIQLSPIKTNFTFELFICAAILLEHKDTLLMCCSEMDLILFTSSLQNKLRLNPILEKAEELFFNYCTGTVLECFRKYYLKPQQRMSGMFLLKNVLIEKKLLF